HRVPSQSVFGLFLRTRLGPLFRRLQEALTQEPLERSHPGVVFDETLPVAGCDVIVLSVKVKEIRLDLSRNIISEESTEVELLDDFLLLGALASKDDDVLQGPCVHIVGEIGRRWGGADPAPDPPVMNGVDQIGLEDEPADSARQHGVVQSALPELPDEVEVL